MASIVGDNKYRSADGSGWAFTDKLFGTLDKAVNIYNKGRSGAVEGDVSYGVTPGSEPEIGIFGLQKPWGGVFLTGGILLLGAMIWKIAK
jgi:hypothetical protein